MLHGPHDDLGLGPEPRDVEPRLHPEPSAHGGTARVVHSSVVPRRPHVAVPRALHREADGVPNGPRLNLVVANQPGEDREARRISGRPPVGAQRVRSQVEDGAAPGRGATAVPVSVEQLVQRAGVAVDHEGVAIRASLDGGSAVEGVGHAVALARVLEVDPVHRMPVPHDREREPVGRPPEVRMQERAPGLHRPKPRPAA